MTTDREKQVLDSLVEAFNRFVLLDQLEHNHPDDLEEFKYGIHLCQMVVSHRIAKRVDPETWGEAMSVPNMSTELREAISKFIRDDYFLEWLDCPNATLDGRTPREVLRAGQEDLIWKAVKVAAGGKP